MTPQEHSTITRLIAGMRKDAHAIFKAGLAAVIPEDAICRHCRLRNGQLLIGEQTYTLAEFDNIFIIGAGKATAAMAHAVEQLLGSRISNGLISVKYSHTIPLKHIRTIESGHPLPDENGLQAARQILTIAGKASAKDLVICLLSGGGSALLPLPCEALTLADKQKTSDLLMAGGATIHEINTIRKHISAIKGGHLAQAVYPATLITLILSDVVGDDPDVIASGPTVPDGSTYADCLRIVDHYQLSAKLPPKVLHHLREGAMGHKPETPKQSDLAWDHMQTVIVANNAQAVQAAALEAEKRGYAVLILSTRMEGETREVARVHGAIAREILVSGHPLPAPACLISGGETTVTIKGKGKGGRNQEFTLAAALDIAGAENIVVLSGGTDGTDGPTDAAGAIADHVTVRRAINVGLDIRDFLLNNDAYTFFSHLNDLLITGPSLTNVMDLRVLLVKQPGQS